MTTQHVILVNENDEPVGVMEKMEAHLKAKLHRAFSVFLFNDKAEMLLQQRAFTKYHSLVYGVMPVVVTPNQEKKPRQPPKDGLTKN